MNSISHSPHISAFPVAVILAGVTLATSISVSYCVNGTLLSQVGVVELAHWGGVRLEELSLPEIWRVWTAQLIHVKWPHMLYNVVCLFAICAVIEPRIGSWRAFMVWALAGAFATLISPVFVDYPYNVGTGASHAVLAFVGCAFVLMIAGKLPGLWPKVIIGIALIPALGLDFVYAGYPKIGHVVALIGGALLGLFFKNSANKKPR